MLLGHFNCAVNPFLYAVLSKDFRESLWSILKCKVTRQPRRTNIYPISCSSLPNTPGNGIELPSRKYEKRSINSKEIASTYV
ncbi:hypothetical protein NPIL_642571 [Nephila pilipes]|uniref:Uncharacterized protein n=1 Tax=Nephila pilipes TaxID=299642 RepID=A0A8X6P2K0_NEPPI|nr:hypothetical protein NPIL_642571 [Nephila pilipes]